MSALDSLVDELADAVAERLIPALRALVKPTPAQPEPALEPMLLSWEQISQRLGGISETGVRALWKSGDLPSVTVGRLRFTRAADLAAYVANLVPDLPEAKASLTVVRDAA